MPRLTLHFFLAFVLFTPPAAAAISPETPINTPVYGESPFQQYAVDAASDGSEYLAVWRDYRGERVVLAAARVSAAGELLDPNGIVIADLIDDLNIGDLRVEWNGSSYVVVWQTFGQAVDVWLARVDRNGEVLTAPRRIVENARLGDVVTNGTRTLIIYEPRPTLMFQELRAALVDENGGITNDSLLPRGRTRYQRLPGTNRHDDAERQRPADLDRRRLDAVAVPIAGRRHGHRAR